VFAALFIGVLVTYPSLTLTVGSVLYLAFIPVSAYRYFQLERRDAVNAKAEAAKTALREATKAGTVEAFPKRKPDSSSSGRSV
jgi:CDP-diacylglycerol--serine O-phosphatidyltransferase